MELSKNQKIAIGAVVALIVLYFIYMKMYKNRSPRASPDKNK
jgi:hypothetical protein